MVAASAYPTVASMARQAARDIPTYGRLASELRLSKLPCEVERREEQ
jgi:hypothetical protein